MGDEVDKLRLPVGGSPLVERVRHALAAVCDEVLLVGGRLPIEDSGRTNVSGTGPAGIRSVPDSRPGRAGPLAGVEAGLAAAGNERALIVAGDMPLLSPELLAYLLELLDEPGALAAVPEAGGRIHPLCAAYARSVRPEVTRALDGGERAVYRLLERLDGVIRVPEALLRQFGDPQRLLMNVNTPNDLRRAESFLEQGSRER